jgi:hypothetical protein
LAWFVLCQVEPKWKQILAPDRHPPYFGAISFSSLEKFTSHAAVNFGGNRNVEVTKALAALQPLYGKDNVEIVTVDGHRVRGVVRSMKTTQALTTPSVKMECADGEIVKIPFPSIAEIMDHNPQAAGADAGKQTAVGRRQ